MLEVRDAALAAPTRGRRAPGTPLGRGCALLTALLCVALLLATAGEVWVRAGIEGEAAVASTANTAVSRDISRTARAVAVARQPATIAREARAWGYVACGCVASPPPQPAPSPALAPPSAPAPAPALAPAAG